MLRAFLLLITVAMLNGCIYTTDVAPAQLDKADKLCMSNGGVKYYNVVAGVAHDDSLAAVVCNNGAIFKQPEVTQ